LRGDLDRSRPEMVGRDQFVKQADPLRLGRVDRLSRQQ